MNSNPPSKRRRIHHPLLSYSVSDHGILRKFERYLQTTSRMKLKTARDVAVCFSKVLFHVLHPRPSADPAKHVPLNQVNVVEALHQHPTEIRTFFDRLSPSCKTRSKYAVACQHYLKFHEHEHKETREGENLVSQLTVFFKDLLKTTRGDRTGPPEPVALGQPCNANIAFLLLLLAYSRSVPCHNSLDSLD